MLFPFGEVIIIFSGEAITRRNLILWFGFFSRQNEVLQAKLYPFLPEYVYVHKAAALLFSKDRMKGRRTHSASFGTYSGTVGLET